MNELINDIRDAWTGYYEVPEGYKTHQTEEECFKEIADAILSKYIRKEVYKEDTQQLMDDMSDLNEKIVKDYIRKDSLPSVEEIMRAIKNHPYNYGVSVQWELGLAKAIKNLLNLLEEQP